MIGSVQLAEVRFLDRTEVKLRPVVVLNEPVGEFGVVIVAPVYSRTIEHKLAGDIEIRDDFKVVGLLKMSTIRLHRLVAMPVTDLKEELGLVTPLIRGEIREGLKALLGL